MVLAKLLVFLHTAYGWPARQFREAPAKPALTTF
jgi:hypothetical protein